MAPPWPNRGQAAYIGRGTDRQADGEHRAAAELAMGSVRFRIERQRARLPCPEKRPELGRYDPAQADLTPPNLQQTQEKALQMAHS